MAFLTSWLYPSNWMSSPNAGFAQNIVNDIAQFEQQLTTTYKAADAALYDRTVFVDYYYQATMGDLSAKYQLTLQPNNWPDAGSPYNKIFLIKPLVTNLDYENLDEQTHAKIDAFIANNIGLFHPTPEDEPGNYAGFRFEDCPGSTNLRKINIVAVNYFEYSSNMPKPANQITAEINKFEAMAKSLSDDLNQVISGKKKVDVTAKRVFTIKPARETDKAKGKKHKVNQHMSPKGAVGDPVSTNLQADQLIAKQSVFNALFTPATGYKRTYWIDMRDGGCQFDVYYYWNAANFVAQFPVVFYTYFNVIKPFQEDQRKFCEDNGTKVMPAGGTLTLQQNEVSYFQYMAQFTWATTLTQDQMQTNIGNFATNFWAFKII